MHEGFEWAVLVMPMGHRCGYVRLPEGHPWYGKPYDEIDVRIHGGLTFSGKLHCPEVASGYWIGFDCAHCFDMRDPDEMDREYLLLHKRSERLGRELGQLLCEALGLYELPKSDFLPEPKIRGRAYVEGQCKQLAAECREIADLTKIMETGSAKRSEEISNGVQVRDEHGPSEDD